MDIYSKYSILSRYIGQGKSEEMDGKLKMKILSKYIKVNLTTLIQGVPTSTVSNSMISTSTNFQKVLHKIVLAGDLISKLILVELTLCTT